MDNYLAELAKSRAELLKEMMNVNWSYAVGNKKIETIQSEIAKIDAMIDKVLTDPAPTNNPTGSADDE